MPTPMIRVRAKSGDLPFVDEMGRVMKRARSVGRDDDGAPLKDGELVPDNAFYRRSIRRDEIEIVPEPAQVAPAASPVPSKEGK
jgi:hypothetical protein